jgi:hypothetical protein
MHGKKMRESKKNTHTSQKHRQRQRQKQRQRQTQRGANQTKKMREEISTTANLRGAKKGRQPNMNEAKREACQTTTVPKDTQATR